jgi:hypothetical protein
MFLLSLMSSDMEKKGKSGSAKNEKNRAGNEKNEIYTNRKDSGNKDAYRMTTEDKEALGPPDLSLDGGEDEELKHRTRPVDFSGEDLDVPGREADDDQEAIGSEDEENNLWSLGGDRHEDLEEDKS